MATSRDIHDLVSKLSSDKVKAREEGIRLLNSWMDGDRSVGFCRLLTSNTAQTSPGDLPSAETWPFLVSLLTKCVMNEISSSKKKLPKLIYAKTLRTAIQRAEHSDASGKNHPLFTIAKSLFNHIFEVLRDVHTFQSEYGIILRQLLLVKDYRVRMKKQVYCSLVHLYINKLEATVGEKGSMLSNAKEENFRWVLTFHSLLEKPPEDFSKALGDSLTNGFVSIFSHIKEESKISRKLLECVNVFLLQDGPNLGSKTLNIHCALQDFISCIWHTTRDRSFKNALILYARIQIKLRKDEVEENYLVQQFFDMVIKELDQNITSVLCSSWDDKGGTMASSQRGLMELAASVIYKVLVCQDHETSLNKRPKRESAGDCVKEGLIKGKWLWYGAFCSLIEKYGDRIDSSLIAIWFTGICDNLDRIFNDGYNLHAYDGLLWILRALHGLSSLQSFNSQSMQASSSYFHQVGSCWHTIWSCIVHWLPLLCKTASLANAAFLVLGNTISNDLITSPNMPQDVWDLQAFKDDLSVGSLYFIAQYFSRGGFQGDLGGNFDLRQKLLKVVFRLNSKGLLLLNGMLMFLPAAIFSLVSGYFVLPPILHQSLLCKYMKCPDVKDDNIEVDAHEQILEHELFECSIDILSRVYPLQVTKEGHSLSNSCFHFPKLSRQKLLIQVEDWALVNMDQKIDHLSLHDLLLFSSFLFVFIYSYTRIGEVSGTSIFLSQMYSHLGKYLHQSVSILDGSHGQIDMLKLSDSLRVLDSISSIFATSDSSNYSPLFSMQKNITSFREILPSEIIRNFERILFYLAKIFEKIPYSSDVIQCELLADTDNNHAVTSGEVRVVDIDLDMDIGASDDSAIVREKGLLGISDINLLKKDLILAMTKLSNLLPDVVIDFLFELLRKEPDPEVLPCIFRCLCKSCINSSSERIAELIDLLVELVNDSDTKNTSSEMLTCTHCLLGSFSASDIIAKDNNVVYKKFSHVGDVLYKFADSGRLHWDGRVELVDCICCFISLVPQIGQGMIDKLLAMVQDPDYRVRLFLARRIGVLFQTWDGHQGLFQDICLSFGVKIVMVSKESLVTADEVLAAGAQSRLVLETALVTLGHVAFMSETVELEAVFMISTSAAIDPSLRELAYFLLSNLSKRLNYDSREKYLEELLGSLISCWITSGVSLVGLVEVRKLFVGNAEASSFLQYCFPWLIPSLILNGKTSDLQWVAMLSSEPVAAIVRKHFVPVFAVCMALHCSEKSSKNDVAAVLRMSILQIADLSENERDGLIKKHMVSIVSCLLSLSSCASDPVVPFFTVQTIVLAIRTIVDGFLEIEDLPIGNSVVDKINIFRPDRVFKFLLDIHYQITGAVHPRHRCHKLASIEVLIIVLGERAIIPSTSSYIFKIAAQFIDHKALHRQCCHIFSVLIRLFQKSTVKETFNTLGEQLQFVVSKLVACYIPSKGSGEVPSPDFTGVLSILRDLIVDADHSLYEYIKDLEPFPELDCFEQFRAVQHKVCKSYHPKDHLLKFVGKSHSLSHKFLLSSLEALHKKLLNGELIQLKKDQKVSWCSEPEIVSAVWMLVGMCGSYDWIDIPKLLADFISRIGIVDPHHVIFQLPYDSFKLCPTQMISVEADVVSSAVLSELLLLLKKYLMDDSAKVIDLASRAIQGILSTERGQAALQSFACFDKSLLKVHSKGVNLSIVDRLIHDVKNASKVVPLEDCSLWDTSGKSYDKWLCPLVHSLISHADDIILRLCEEIVLVKADMAELLFPIVLANLAQRKEMASNIRLVVSTQVQDCIFTESNELLKSIQLLLNAMNMLRIGHITTKLNATQKQVASKVNRSSGYSSRSRVVSERSKDSSPLIAEANSISSEKVYWLSIDYLATAKAAVHCGSYFTAVMYVEHWCEERFNAITIGEPDFSPNETLSPHIELLVSAMKHINEPDGIYGIIQSHKLTLQSITHEHEGNWRKAIECYDLLLSTTGSVEQVVHTSSTGLHSREGLKLCALDAYDADSINHKAKDLGDKHGSYKGLMRCLQQNGCTHILDFYRKGLTAQRDNFQQDSEFVELQYEAAWRVGNWEFSLNSGEVLVRCERRTIYPSHFHANLHSCLRALQNGDLTEFFAKLSSSKQELVLSICQSSKESTENIYTAIIRLQILDHLGMAWGLRWPESTLENRDFDHNYQELLAEPATPSTSQMDLLTEHWDFILKQTQFHLHLLEPFIAFRRVLLQILNCKPCLMQHLLQSARTLRKGSRLSQALAALHELKSFSLGKQNQKTGSYIFSLGRLEEAKLLRDQGQQEMAINLAKYILHHCEMKDETSNVYRLVGKWLTEMRSSNSRTILEQYLKQAVELVNGNEGDDNRSVERKCRTYFHLAHYADALFKSNEERLASSEWQAAMRLRRHKTKELEALIKRLKSLAKAEKTDYSVKIQELQKQLSIDKEEAERLQDDRDHFLDVALAGYRHCLVAGDKYDLRVVFRLVSLWFSLCSRSSVISSMLETVKEVQSCKFLPLVYQIASRMGSGSKDTSGSHNFQYVLVSLVKKMATEHPYHTIFQLLALANGDRVKDKQRSRNSFVVDMEKKYAAENLLKELSTHHGNRIMQMKQMVETYIKLAELDTKKEDTNKKITLPREIRCLRQLELVPVVTATLPVDHSCQYVEGSFPHFTCLADTVVIMNGINAPKVVECFGSNGKKYRQLAKSGNDDLRQDAVMEQFFGLVNTFLHNNRDTWKRRLRIRTYKVVPFTPSAGILEWVDGTIPLGDYLIGSHRNGGAHGRYGIGDWTYVQCREYMTNEKDKRKSFEKVCDNFRPVLHHFFLERYLQAPQWFENRLFYTKSVAASSMVGYIVGLGDRHSLNILIDEVTAEVVHIDLGVAFEQGLMLKTPERVPFRLTRDIIDGMGVTGVEGVFRRCCEETLSVMRTNKEALLTIIEVFIHDPLYKWALSPLKALQRQKETDDDLDSSLEDSQDVYEGNKDAARALMRVKQKLDGYEEGEMRSVQGQVQQLIQNAVDVDRLCQMFPGWGAWL